MFFKKNKLKNPNKYKVRDDDKNTLFEKTDTKIWLWANYIILFFILLSVFLVWVDTIPELSNKYFFQIFIADLIISIVFLVEYIYRWKHSNDKIMYPFYFMNILHLLSFLPFFILVWIYWIWTYSVFILFRILRIFRIFELIERIPIITKIIIWVKKHKIEYLASISLILIILVLFSTTAYYSEFYYWNKLFSSLPETIWWAIVTMTNTWYWDLVPITFIWKSIAVLLMFLWPILITILSSITVIIFIESTQIIDLWKWKKKCNNCLYKNKKHSNYCNNCWKNI